MTDFEKTCVFPWFRGCLESAERKMILDSVPDMMDSAVWVNASPAYGVADWLQWISRADNEVLCRKVADKAVQLYSAYEKKMTVTDCHFFWNALIENCYKFRDSWGVETIKNWCKRQISLAEDARLTFSIMPCHTGYDKLCILEKKEKHWGNVVFLCESALRQGWCGDWEKRITEAKKHMV